MFDNNVIDGRRRFADLKTRRGNIQSRESLEQRIMRTARVPHEDKPIMAKNLGHLAARLDPQNPLNGAKAIFSRAELDALWEKRKRFIRLPNEECPLPTQGGEYGSSGATFARLALAAGDLLAPSRSDQTLASERARAIRILAQSTSLNPAQFVLKETDQSAKSLIDDYAEVLAEVIAKRTRISDLWSILRDTPFGITTPDFSEETAQIVADYGDAARVPELLLKPMFHNISEAFFDPNSKYDFEWQSPIIELGSAAFRMQAKYFAVPDDAASLFLPGHFDEDGLVGRDALDWLDQIGWDGTMGFPNVDYTADQGWGWRSATMSVFKRVGLCLAEGDATRPQVKILSWGNEGFGAVNFSDVAATVSEDAIAATDDLSSELRFVDVDGSNLLQTVPRNFCRDDEVASGVIGLIDPLDAHMTVTEETQTDGWTDDPPSARLLFGQNTRFFPTLPSCPSKGGPFRKESLAASLFENARCASDDQSLTRLLTDKAHVTAESGLQFHQVMIERYREVLRQI